MGRKVVSISGKGGVGKTTLAALLLKALIEGDGRDILVVDADPATNLPDAVGVSVESTVGTMASRLKRQIRAEELPPGVPKADILESWVVETLVETPDFDLLAMGRTEGEGCYCMVNNLLTRILDTLTRNYDLTIMDMEPGLEHLSRRTDRDVDVMFIVTDPTRMGFRTARRIRDLTREVHIGVRRLYLVGNRFPKEMEPLIVRQSRSLGIELAGIVPNDPDVFSYSVEGRSLLGLPAGSPAAGAVREIAVRTGLVA